MKTITVEAEVEILDILSELDTKDLIDELLERGENIPSGNKGIIELNSVQDQIKFEALKQKFYDIPEADLDEFLSRY